jgi:hypothetical protein
MRKGQEEAPIELLLGVTILTFVVILGFYTYQNLCASMYNTKMLSSLKEFANAIEGAYHGSVDSPVVAHVDFSGSGCTVALQSIKLIQGPSSACMKALAKSDCSELVALTKSSSTLTTYMVDVPSSVSVSIKKSSTCVHLNGMNVAAATDPALKECGWTAQEYVFTITKDSSNEISIEQTG